MLAELTGTVSQESNVASVPGASSRATPDPEHEEPPLLISRLIVGSVVGGPMIYKEFRTRLICRMVLHSGFSGFWVPDSVSGFGSSFSYKVQEA